MLPLSPEKFTKPPYYMYKTVEYNIITFTLKHDGCQNVIYLNPDE
jgi:hypothetical protein